MMRLVLILLCAVFLGAATPTVAQKPTAAPPAISADQARAALEVLNDPAKRAAFAATLNALIKAQPATPAPAAGAPAEPAAAPPTHTTVEGVSIPLAPDSLGAQILLSASAFVSHLGTQAMDALQTVQSVPLLYGWGVMVATNPMARNILLDVSWRVILALAIVIAVEYGLRRSLRRPLHGLERLAPHARPGETSEPPPESEEDAVARAEAGDIEAPPPPRPRPSAWTLLRRVPLVLGRLILELIPVLGIAVIGHLFAGSALAGQTVSRLIILAIVDAYALCVALLSLVHMLLSPEASRLRLFHLHDTTAAYLMYWARRLIPIAVIGYALGEVGLLLGLSDIARDALEKGVGLVLHVCLAYIVIRKRAAVRRWIRAPEGRTGVVARLRNGFARVWHWVALFFLVAVWLVWAIEVPHGFAAALHYFFLTSMVLIAARFVLLLLVGVIDRLMRPASDSPGLFPGMHARLQVYHPIVTIALRLTIYLLCVLGLLQLYGLNTFLWLVQSALGLRILAASGTLLVTIVLAFTVWEVVNGGIQGHLDRLDREAQIARSARLRTLLPLLRSTLLITIAVVAGLMILSEIGINIAPLLAGAGIVGVAIGFGSQKLVQDLITGIFLLLENAMQVGDVVSVGGLAGVVESLSVRTIRLRSEDGSVFLIPFSSVTTVTNMTKDYSRAVIVASVAYKEDYDKVVVILKAIVQEMRAETAWKSIIRDDLEVWGLDQFADSAVAIKCRIMCTPFGRWSVMREFNRRMKMRFDEHGIEIPFPHRKLIVDALPAVTMAGIQEVPNDAKRAAD